MSHWSENYIGLPYSDYDCAQLCNKVLKERFNKNIKIPERREKGLKGISNMITELKDDFGTKTLKPVEGDAALMIGRGRLNHIGIVCYIEDELFILHAMRNAKITVMHQLSSLKSLGLELEGFYSWK